MDLSFGTRLRLQRERQQVALSAIAAQTKIKASLLDGLERDDLSRWPGGIFRRAYVRAYAVAIGLEPDGVVREFLERYPDPEEEEPAIAAGRAVEGDSNRRPPTRLGNLISSAMGALPALRTPTALKPGPVAGRGSAPEDGFGGVRIRTGGHTETASDCASPLQGGPLARQESSHPAVDVEIQLDAGEAEPQLLFEEAYAPTARPDSGVPAPTHSRPPAVVELGAMADLCTRLSRAVDARQIAPVLADAARMLEAVGLILWTWDRTGRALLPALTHGYADDLVAHLPHVTPDADNAIAWAFRSEETRTIPGSDLETGALAVPLMTPSGCTGVLALELRNGDEGRRSIRAAVEILAAQLSALVGHPPVAQAAVNT